MNDAQFLPANKVFTGRMRDNKEKGLDVSQARESIEQDDMNKLFNSYFKPGIERMNTQVLVHKVFFNIVYYIEITFNEKTKKNQGGDNSSSKRALHDDHHIISQMPENPLCPVKSFKTYLSLLNHHEPAFFQYPNKLMTGYKNSPIGKNILGTFMKEISEAAKLSKIYTNHCIRKTTATAMKRKGFDLNEISNVTKHKNLDPLKHYIGGPTYNDKKRYNEAMSSYATEPKEKSPKKTKVTALKTPELQEKSNEDPNMKALVPVYNNSQDSNSIDNICVTPATTQQNVVNQLRNASHLFQNANFSNCNFTFQMPK